ncbi:hypothetical protein HDK77DRAFT_314736 [Phyllosticta capitalensis]|uniref:uncharacterized protein n=1 Tax=Phyllosticta capitalensis TaxID=121624 RepID=UPI003130E48F
MRAFQILVLLASFAIGCFALAATTPNDDVDRDKNGNPICTPKECSIKCTNDDPCKQPCKDPATTFLVGNCIHMEGGVRGCFCSCVNDDQCNGVCGGLTYNSKDAKLNKAFQLYTDIRTCITKTQPEKFNNAYAGCLCDFGSIDACTKFCTYLNGKPIKGYPKDGSCSCPPPKE